MISTDLLVLYLLSDNDNNLAKENQKRGYLGRFIIVLIYIFMILVILYVIFMFIWLLWIILN